MNKNFLHILSSMRKRRDGAFWPQFGVILLLVLSLWAQWNLTEEEQVRERVTVERQPAGQRSSEPDPISIRVLLMDSDYEEYEQESVTICTEKTQTVYTPGDSRIGEDGLILDSRDFAGGIEVSSIVRGQGTPAYTGTLEIHRGEDGLYVINELPLEEYLKKVVPSEMPGDYPLEALKAQAVCARTYAVRQILDQRLKEYGADVDDSVNFQVYNNQEASPSTEQAVEETAGEILCASGEPIQAYFFSTSSGKTSTDQVWESAQTAPYLKSVACTYDSQDPWGHWEVSFTLEELDSRFQQRYPDLGNLRELKVRKRSDGGAAIQMEIVGESGSHVIHNEYDIRALFCPYGKEVIQQDGNKVVDAKLLPSAYFSLEPLQGEAGLEGYRFVGGGYGHGVGMSQNGANHMALEGQNYWQILEYFFQQVEIESVEEALKLASQ